jgi:nucleotide-binding universal stress UspA family protein
MTVILAAIDDSAAATPVLETAVAIAPVMGAHVRALHVGDEVGRTAQSAADAAHIPLEVLHGEPLDELRRRADADDVAVVVLGLRGRPTSPRRAGRVAIAIANATPKPVVVVPPEARVPDRVRRVLIAMEGTPGKARELRRAVELADAAQLELNVVHVDDETSIPLFSDQVQYETEAYANEFLARNAPGVKGARLELRVGVPADEILRAADEVKPDLLAIGWRQSDDPARGRVAREIVSRSPIPVFLVALADDP